MKRRLSTVLCMGILTSLVVSPVFSQQKGSKRPTRANPPKFQSSEFSGVFYSDPFAQLSGTPPTEKDASSSNTAMSEESNTDAPAMASGNGVWKQLISASTIEDLVKESKGRVDNVITTPAKFAGGGYADARREFTLLASLMAVIGQYPEEIRWKSSAGYAKSVFARFAANCKVGTQQVFNEAKLRQQDLADLLKGSKISGNADEVTWADIADRGPSMKILDWALRENIAPATSSDSSFKSGQDEIVKYAELVAALGQILQQEGMTDADDAAYNQLSAAMVKASRELITAVKNNEPELARSAVGRIDQSCNKCHEGYR